MIEHREALITGNPQSTMTRVEVGYDVDMGVSVFVKGKPLHKVEYVTHYAVKGTMIVEEYVKIYDNKQNYMPTLFQPREKDYMYLYSKEEYRKEKYDDHKCEREIAQFMNCASPGTEEQNNCKSVPFTNFLSSG